MERVFIAGTTANLGRQLCADYQRRGWYVIALVSKTPHTKPIAADQLVEAQATDPVSLKGVMAGADLVVSCLGITRQTDGLGYWDVDDQANLNLLREAERAGVSRFAYFQVLDANTSSQVPMDAAKSTFMAELQRYGMAATIINPSDGSAHGCFVSGIVVLDMACARYVTRNMTDHYEHNLARTKTASIHQINPEGN